MSELSGYPVTNDLIVYLVSITISSAFLNWLQPGHLSRHISVYTVVYWFMALVVFA